MTRLKQFITEIHRRTLWQVLLIYVGGAWICYEIIDTITDRLALPEWLPVLAIILFLIGLPVVLATAFVHEVTPPTVTPGEPTALTEAEATRLEAEATAVHLETRRRHRFLTSRNAVASFVVALAVWGVVATGWMLFGERATPEEVEARKSIAVLPFENIGGAEENVAFTDGIHDDIITHLQKIGDLKPISRTSVLEYRERRENLKQIADELGVETILEGGVQRSVNRVRINVQLINAETDEHLWAETYDEDLTAENVFAVQTDIAKRIASALKATLTAQTLEQIERVPTENLEAYDLYLRGMEYSRRGGSENARIAEEMFLKALELDPDFALAYAALARGHSDAYYLGWDRSQKTADKARDAAHRAFELDPDLAEAHSALARYFTDVMEDHERARQELAVVQKLNPNSDLLGIAWNNAVRGEWDEALTNWRRAVELSPREPNVLGNVGGWLVYMRRYDEAMPLLDRYVVLAPDGVLVWAKALAYLNQPDGVENALQVVRDLERARGGPSPGVNLSGGAVWWWQRMAFRILHDHFRERAREPIPASATDSGGYFLAKAISYDLDGETVHARAYYDSARVAYEARIERSAEDSVHPRLCSALGVSYAGLGRAEDAVREATRAVELTPPTLAVGGGQSSVLSLAEVYVMVGEYDAAIDRLDHALSIPSLISVPLLRVDPLWDPLRDHPRFQALLERYE
jgi:TolB-like protein/Flp pilus assembly protein TadD